MTTDARTLRTILVCGGLILTLSVGLRVGFGFFLRPMTMEFGWPRETFSFAIALHNLFLGASQPFLGALADRYGAPRVVVVSALLYAIGLAAMSVSSTGWMLSLSAGLIVGLAAAGTGFAIVIGVIGRAFPPEQRSNAIGICAALGSFGQFFMAPVEQALISTFGWSGALLVLAAISLIMIPMAGGLRDDRHAVAHLTGQTVRQALAQASATPSFWLLMGGYFVCGFHVTFVATHLPAYLRDQGLAVGVGVAAIALIGLFNIFGSYASGRLGAVYTKKYLLAGVYFSRSVVIALFALLPLSPYSAYAFGIAFGLLYLSTVPLTNGLIADIFGVRYLAMLSGLVFFSHQIGSFFGAWLGGRLFDLSGSYGVVWSMAIALGVIAALFNLPIREKSLERQATATL
ncbi:MAG: MFS transporter [Betaproteobacteria bacterium]|nr:MFS transporter [Betaproteobacteria bacterium]